MNSLLAEHMTLEQAATLLGVSPRHTRHMLPVSSPRPNLFSWIPYCMFGGKTTNC